MVGYNEKSFPSSCDARTNMTRTFSILASLLLFLLFATMVLGFLSFSLEVSEFKKDIYIAHFYLGLTTAILMLLVHCLIFTYFLGTGRWVKEVTLAYQLPDEPWHKATRELKRQTFPPALYSMLIAIATAAAGAGAQLQEWPWFVHASLAILTLVINLWAFRIEYNNVAANAGIIQAVLDEVDRIRLQHGLICNAEALLED
jgi:hypothetical protein